MQSMKITAIRQQERRKGRYSIYVDGTYGFSLSEIALLESKLAIGQELTGDQIKSYKQLSAEDKMYGNALRYAAMRRRSQWELETYLRRKEASPALARQIVNKLSDLGFVDDEAFARAWVENRRLLRPTSRRKLQQELRAKHVANGIIEQVLRQDQASDQEGLRAVIARKRRQAKYQDDQKLMQYLARQGFGYEDIKAAIQEA